MSKANLKNHVRESETPSRSTNAAHARAWELARQQGVKPIKSIKDLKGDFWPEDESADEFLEWLRSVRREGERRSILE